MRPLSYITITIRHNLPFSTSAIILPPPSKKACPQALYIYIMSMGILIFILNRQLIVFTILALYLLIKALQRSRLIRVLVIEFFKLIGITYKVLYRVLSGVQIISFLTNIILQCSPYKFIGQYFFSFLFIIAINLNQQGRFILLSR